MARDEAVPTTGRMNTASASGTMPIASRIQRTTRVTIEMRISRVMPKSITAGSAKGTSFCADGRFRCADAALRFGEWSSTGG